MNPYPTNSFWIGDRYRDETNPLRGALILGESTYGPVRANDPQWIHYFIDCQAKRWQDIDRMFGRLHWFMTDRAETAGVSYIELYKRSSRKILKSWFNRFAFTNFVTQPLLDRKKRVSGLDLAKAREDLSRVLERIQPKGIWVMGARQEPYSVDVLEGFGIPRENIEVMRPHPSWISNLKGWESWARFRAIMRRVNGHGG